MNPLSAWNRFFFGPISARPLGVFRIALGTTLLGYLALMTVEFDYWYTGAGLLQGTEAREAAGPFRFSPLLYVNDPIFARACLGLTAAAALGFTLGWRTRLMNILLYLGMLSLYHRNVTANGGPDALPFLMTFYMMLCPSGAAYSLDARRAAKKRGTKAEPLIVPWGVRLLQMQICLIYFQSCVIKCQGASWLDGTTVHYLLFNREFGQFNVEWLAQYPLVINLMTHGSIWIEFALAFWLWFRPTRRWAILGGIALHLGIRPMLNVPAFGEVMTATYITFLAPDELEAFLSFLSPRALLARLSSGLSGLAFWRGSGRPIPFAAWQQLEFPFEGAGASAAPEPVTAG
jgi:hypothetical protein